MKNLIKITGMLALVLLVSCLVIFLIGMLWSSPKEGLIHNLFRYSCVGWSSIGGIWVLLFVYREIIEG